MVKQKPLRTRGWYVLCSFIITVNVNKRIEAFEFHGFLIIHLRKEPRFKK